MLKVIFTDLVTKRCYPQQSTHTKTKKNRMLVLTNLVPQDNSIVFQVSHLNNRIEKKKQRKS